MGGCFFLLSRWLHPLPEGIYTMITESLIDDQNSELSVHINADNEAVITITSIGDPMSMMVYKLESEDIDWIIKRLIVCKKSLK